MNRKDNSMNYADLNGTIYRLFGDSQGFDHEQQALRYVTEKLELRKAMWARAIAKGGTVTEMLGRVERYNEDETAAATDAGKELGRAWAQEQQQGYDMRWLDPNCEYVELSLFDLSFAMRDAAYDGCLCEHTTAFIEGAREYFQEVEDRSTVKDDTK